MNPASPPTDPPSPSPPPARWWRLGRDERRAFLAAAGAAVIVPLLFAGWTGVRGILRFLAYDAFYYLEVASRSRGLDFTLDGSHPVNGFHPLWQLLLRALHGIFGLADDPGAGIVLSFALSAVGVALGAGLLAASLVRLGVAVPWALVAVVPGPFYLAVGGLFPTTASTAWNHLDGMESGLVFAAVGLIALIAAGETRLEALDRGRARALAVGLALLVGSRLDEAFVLAGVGVLALAAGGVARERLARTARLLLPAASLLAVFVLWNWARTGGLLPISAVSKAGDALAENLGALERFGFVFVDRLGGGRTFRTVNLLGPPLIAGVGLAFWGRGRERLPLFLQLLLPAALLKAAFVAFGVVYWGQGQWYFVASTVAVNYLVAVTLLRPGARPAFRWRELAPVLVLVAIASWVCVLAKTAEPDKDRVHALYLQRDAAREAILAASADGRVVEFDDGVIGALLGLPTLNFGPMMDADAWRRSQGRSLLEVAWTRGYRLLASVQYLHPARRASSSEDLQGERLRHLLAEEPILGAERLGRWSFDCVLCGEDAPLTVLRFRPLERGRHVFRLAAPEARAVRLAGSFNDWQPERGRMVRGAAGDWSLEVVLPSGEVEYRFVVDDRWTEDPANPRRVDNGLGGFNSVVTVASEEWEPAEDAKEPAAP